MASRDLLDAAVQLLGNSEQCRVLPIQGESMVPTLRSGRRVAVRLDVGALERGDLLLYRQLDYLVVHRLLGPADREDGAPRLRTRGDGRSELDPPLDRSRIRGRVVAVERGDGWWDLTGGAARAYAVGVALHDLFWAAAFVAARRAELALGRAGWRIPLAERVAALDRLTLRLADAALFRRLHRSLPDPR